MDKNQSAPQEDIRLNKMLEGNDKFPGEEEGRADLVTNDDLKGKKNDGDPSKKEDQPLGR